MAVLIYDRVLRFLARTRPFRLRYGPVTGMRLALQLRRHHALPSEQVYKVNVPRLAHPVWLRCGTSDAAVFRDIFITGDLSFALEGCPSLIVDAGANIGLASISFAARYPSARIIALEIDRANYELLRRNVFPYPNIVPLRKGLWSGRTRLMITNPNAACWAYQGAEAGGTTRHADAVDAVGVADLLAEFGDPIDLLKIDIEGGEYEVFSPGCESWLGGVHTLAVELHERFRPGCRAALDRAVAGRGYIESRSGAYSIFSPGKRKVEGPL